MPEQITSPPVSEQRRGQRFWERPSTSQPATDDRWWKANSTRPFREAEGFALIRLQMRPTHILCLLFPRRPPHIAGLVVSVVIDAVQFVFRARLRADVGKERRERLDPFGTDPDAAASVIRKFLCMWIQAALFRVGPRAVFGCAIAKFGLSVCGSSVVPFSGTCRAPKRTVALKTTTVTLPRELCAAMKTVAGNILSSHCRAASLRQIMVRSVVVFQHSTLRLFYTADSQGQARLSLKEPSCA